MWPGLDSTRCRMWVVFVVTMDVGGNICLTLHLSSSRFNGVLYERSKACSVIGAAGCNSRPAGKDVSSCLTIIPRASAGYELGITILYPTSASGIHDG